MQPSPTMFSGVLEDSTVLKFCSEECKGLWFHSTDQKPFYVASYLDESSMCQQPVAPLMTIVVAGVKSVEQFYLSVKEVSEAQRECSNVPFIIWHIRCLESQYFAHFYISKECFPLEDVWMKHFCTASSEMVSSMIEAGRTHFQPTIQKHFDQATKIHSSCTFDFFIKEAQLTKCNKVPLLRGKFVV